MAILVTGGAGYIGSVVVDDLVDGGHEVVVLDNLSRGHRESVNERSNFYEGDIGDRGLIERICSENDLDAVMHFSALAYVGESVEQPSLYYRNNTIQTVSLLDELIANDVRKFVFSSTCATYGEPQRLPLDETHPQNPENPYGWSKLFVEKVMQDYDRAYGLRFVALRYFNACGATERRCELHDPETHLIPLILDTAAGKRPHISVFGGDYPTADGTAIRDYIHVSDLSRAHLLALEYLRDGGSSTAANLGNGTGFSVLEVIEASRKVTGKDIPVAMEPRRPGDPSSLVANAAKASEVLGWKPEITSIEEIIRSAWQWGQKDAVSQKSG
ncbi:MAG TPA: UDP-glucose 4-epimerase GalE [Pyrinomonadaceae bacterium]|nr:UDP-glucose 4-epimerase GalE [Pyrinomonadaceae bacterium]